MIEIGEQHEAAERVAKLLGFDVTPKGIRFRGREPSPLVCHKAYAEAWGRDYALRVDYIEPNTLLRLLGDLASANAQISRESLIDDGYYRDIFDYVDSHFHRLGIEITESGVWSYMYEGHRIDYSMGLFLNRLKAEAPGYNASIPKDSGIPPVKVEAIAPAVSVYLHNKESDRIRNLRAMLEYRRTDCADEFVERLLSIYYIEPSIENISAFKHLIWQIKRNIWALPVPEPLFYCFHSSRQHMGKTTLLRKLCTGFEWAYSGRGKLTDLLSAKEYKAMVRGKFLLDFQELALGNIRSKDGGIDEATVVALKSLITSDTISGREMYTSSDAVERQTAVFASSTNKHIWDVVSDPSGMRRYWEFTMRPPEEFNTEFYLEANVFFDNILDLYQSIDECDPDGFFHPSLPQWRGMRKIQEGYAKENAFLRYAHQMGWEFVAEEEPGATKVEVKRIVERFNNYLLDRGDQKWSARYVVWAIATNRDLSPITEQIPGSSKLREFYFVKGVTK